MTRYKKSSPKVAVSTNGVRVYEPNTTKYWRIVWRENGRSRDTSAKTADAAFKKAAEIEKRIMRSSGDKELQEASLMLAAYLDPHKRSVNGSDWGASHDNSQRLLIKKYVAPKLEKVTCDAISNELLREIVAQAPSDSVADHLQRCLSAMINWASRDGWLSKEPKTLLAGISHDRRRRSKLRGSRAGETLLFVDKRNIPSHDDVKQLAEAMAEVGHDWWYELLAYLAAYSGLRLGELLDLDIDSIDINKRVITVTTQCLQVNGKATRTAPKWGTTRKTVFPVTTPQGYALKKALERRIKELKSLKEMPTLADGTQRLLLFPNANGSWMNRSNFSGRIRKEAQELAGWPKQSNGQFLWTFHSLRHVFCTYYLFDLGKDLRDVSIAAGHKSYTTTMEMYVGNSEGAIKRLNQ